MYFWQTDAVPSCTKELFQPTRKGMVQKQLPSLDVQVTYYSWLSQNYVPIAPHKVARGSLTHKHVNSERQGRSWTPVDSIVLWRLWHFQSSSLDQPFVTVLLLVRSKNQEVAYGAGRKPKTQSLPVMGLASGHWSQLFKKNIFEKQKTHPPTMWVLHAYNRCDWAGEKARFPTWEVITQLPTSFRLPPRSALSENWSQVLAVAVKPSHSNAGCDHFLFCFWMWSS